MVKNPPTNAGEARDADLMPGLGRSPGVGNDNPLQCSYLEDPIDRGARQATVHGVTNSRIRLSTHALKIEFNERVKPALGQMQL